MAPVNATLLLVRGSALHSTIRAGIVTAPVCFNQDVKALIPDKSVTPKYLTIYLLAMENTLLKLVSSAGNSAGVLDTELVQNFKFLKPPLQEQEAIAKALSDMDALIQSLEQQIIKKQQIKQGAMQTFLTGKIRLEGFGKKKGYIKTEVGIIPEDWFVVELSTLLMTPPKYGINAPAVKLEGKLPAYIRITDIDENGYFNANKRVGVNDQASDQYVVEDGDILLARTGASVGKSYIYRPEDGKLVYAGFLIKVAPDQNKLESQYLFQFLKTEMYWSWVNVMSMRSGQPGINGNEYGQLRIPLPPSKAEQKSIAKALGDMDSEIFSLKSQLTKHQKLKQGMMQNLLTGTVRLV